MEFGSLIGPIIGGAFQLEGTRQTNTANRDIAEQATAANVGSAREQMQFQERMSNTAHQREVEDLRKAGLNPLLSLNAGASSPPGASAQAATATMQNEMEGIANSARETAQMFLNIKKQQKEMDLMDAQTQKAKTEAKVISKGVPEADIKNRAYNLLKPLLDKFDGPTSSNTRNIRERETSKQNIKNYFNNRKP